VGNLKLDPHYPWAEVEAGTTLYRVTSPTWADPSFLLNGAGANHGHGRFHRIHHATSYVSDNVLLCIAERLYHMSHVAYKKLANKSYAEFKCESSRLEVIVIFETNQLPNLVHLDSAVAIQYSQLNPSAITQSDSIYDPLSRAGDQLRTDGAAGVVYASARHSIGHSLALFGNHSALIDRITARVKIRLSLASEDLSILTNDPSFNPISVRLSQHIGHFAIDAADFGNYQYLLNPALKIAQGFLPFHRIFYGSKPYPQSAIT